MGALATVITAFQNATKIFWLYPLSANKLSINLQYEPIGKQKETVVFGWIPIDEFGA